MKKFLDFKKFIIIFRCTLETCEDGVLDFLHMIKGIATRLIKKFTKIPGKPSCFHRCLT
jgi:hypothetical protein